MADVIYLGRSFTSNTVYTTTYSQVTTTRQTGWEWRSGVYGVWRISEVNNIATIMATIYTTATDSYDTLLKTVAIPYIRAKTIYFVCEAMRPLCRHHIYFDGTNVDRYITRIVGAQKVLIPVSYWGAYGRFGQSYTYTTPATDSNPLTTDEAGFCSGYFYLPAGMFKTGERRFNVTDAISDAGDWTSAAETTYTSQGKLETRQQTNTTSLYSASSSVVSRQDKGIINSSSTMIASAPPVVKVVPKPVPRRVVRNWGDPIAQTFRVENTQGAPGAFITGVEIWFQTKDPIIPITMQIRDSDNGYPGSGVLRSVTMSGGQVTTGLDKPTFFRLDRPLFIESFVDYAVVLMANSQKYNAYICTLGQNQLVYDPTNNSKSNVFSTPAAISKQPYLGSFFMSQNGTTWSADQMSDLAFRIYRAEFDASADYYFHTAHPQTAEISGSVIRTVSGSANVYIELQDHGFGVDSSITPTWWSYASLVCRDFASAGLTAANITGTRQIVSIDERGFTFTAGATASATGVWDVGYLEVGRNSKADVIHPICGGETMQGTEIAYSYKSTTGQSIGGSQHMYQKDADWITYIPNQDIIFETPRLFASAINEAQGMSGANSFEQKISIKTDNAFVSPVLDLNKIGVTSISHTLNNPTNDNEATASEGLALARYVSKSVTLENPATSLRLIVAGNIISGNSISAYYRIVSPENNVPISTLAWSPLSGNTTKNASVREQFIDYTFEATGLTPFTTYQIKIVLKGINSAIPPIIKDVRTMALAV